MNIGQTSSICGLPVKTIRYYEEISLIKPARSSNGYRDYCGSDVNVLVFLKRARELDFSIGECRLLLSLYQNKQRESIDVKKLALAKIEQIEIRIDELQALNKILRHMANNCNGDSRADCAILDGLAGRVELS